MAIASRVGRAVERAWQEHLLVPAFNAAHLPMVRPICEALAQLDCFGLVEVARVDLVRHEARSLAAIAAAYQESAHPRYTGLHLDHVPVVDEEGRTVEWRAMIEEALALGYDSVMVDGSRLPLDQNIAVAREVAEMAHATGTPVEAELGAVYGHEPGPPPDYEELYASGRGFTAPEEAARFVAETEVDWLSVACGNIHGAVVGAAARQPKVRARLNIAHLRRLAAAARIPLVLHGGTGIPAEYLREAARHGIAKINIGTEIRQAYEAAFREGQSEARAQEAVAGVARRILASDLAVAGSASLVAGEVG